MTDLLLAFVAGGLTTAWAQTLIVLTRTTRREGE